MIIIYSLFILLMFVPFPKITGKDDDTLDQYLSKDSVLPVKGFFLMLVFFRHFIDYADLSNGILDRCFLFADGALDQLIVTLFFFYSGFGIYESIKRKGPSYITRFPLKRFLPVWTDFAVCVSFFLIYDLITGQKYDIKTILAAFSGWTEIGNSNWFMFVTFAVYVLIFISFVLFIRSSHFSELLPVLLFTVLTIVLAMLLYLTRPVYWYSTVFCYPAGMLFSFHKEKADSLIKRHYGLLLILLVLLFASFRAALMINYVLYCFYSVIFCLLFVLVTVRLRFRNPFFVFLGKHVFSFFILQRLVFMILERLGLNTYLFFMISLAVTAGVSVIYDRSREQIIKRIHAF